MNTLHPWDWVFAYTLRVLIMYVKRERKKVTKGTRHWHLNFLPRKGATWHSTPFFCHASHYERKNVYGIVIGTILTSSFRHKCITLTLNCRLNFNIVRKLVQQFAELLRELSMFPKVARHVRHSLPHDGTHKLFLHKFSFRSFVSLKKFSIIY